METEPTIVTTRGDRSIDLAGRSVHMIGIGGSGMRALAKVLTDCDAKVSGSDLSPSGAIDRLTQDGIDVHIGHSEDNLPIGCDLVVHSAAIKDNSPELIAARQRGCRILKYSQMLGELMSRRTGIAIAGTHGKSTTTGMVAYSLWAAGADPSFIVGATVGQLGGPSGTGAGATFVAEACEFDRSFLNLHPSYAAILNIEEDHLDCYQDLADIVEAFRCFSAQVSPDGVLIANGEDRSVLAAISAAGCEVETFGLADNCTWRGANVSDERGMNRLDVLYNGQKFCRLTLSLPGLHNAYNALAGVALLHHCGLEPSQISFGLDSFEGIWRRMTLKADVDGIKVVDDYAHHPTEIQATLRAIDQYYRPNRLFCVFQPHQHSRTRLLLKDFAQSFALADEVIVPDIYFVRDSELEKDYISAKDLVSQIRLHGGSATYCDSFAQIATRLQSKLTEGDLVVTMGAGNIWEVADETVLWLRSNR